MLVSINIEGCFIALLDIFCIRGPCSMSLSPNVPSPENVKDSIGLLHILSPNIHMVFHIQYLLAVLLIY